MCAFSGLPAPHLLGRSSSSNGSSMHNHLYISVRCDEHERVRLQHKHLSISVECAQGRAAAARAPAAGSGRRRAAGRAAPSSDAATPRLRRSPCPGSGSGARARRPARRPMAPTPPAVSQPHTLSGAPALRPASARDGGRPHPPGVRIPHPQKKHSETERRTTHLHCKCGRRPVRDCTVVSWTDRQTDRRPAASPTVQPPAASDGQNTDEALGQHVAASGCAHPADARMTGARAGARPDRQTDRAALRTTMWVTLWRRRRKSLAPAACTTRTSSSSSAGVQPTRWTRSASRNCASSAAGQALSQAKAPEPYGQTDRRSVLESITCRQLSSSHAVPL
jgi:hypothetical protein